MHWVQIFLLPPTGPVTLDNYFSALCLRFLICRMGEKGGIIQCLSHRSIKKIK